MNNKKIKLVENLLGELSRKVLFKINVIKNIICIKKIKLIFRAIKIFDIVTKNKAHFKTPSSRFNLVIFKHAHNMYR